MGIIGKLFGKGSERDTPINWKVLQSEADLDELLESSKDKVCLIFKHSTRCSISSMAQHRLDRDWDLADDMIDPWYLDLISYREISNLIAQRLGVQHESPQVILVKDSQAIFDSSHGAISVDSIRRVLQAA